MKQGKICFVCSAGGHLTEILQIKECFSKYDNFYITFRRLNTEDLEKENKVYFVQDPKRNPINTLKCFSQTLSTLLEERPDIVISTGAGVAIPACYIAKLFLGSKIIFIESFCRVDTPSLSGKMIYPIADLFFVQWEQLLKKYGKRAIYRGAII